MCEIKYDNTAKTKENKIVTQKYKKMYDHMIDIAYHRVIHFVALIFYLLL